VATTLLVAGPTLTFAYLGRLRLHPPARTQASLKGARLLIQGVGTTTANCKIHLIQCRTEAKHTYPLSYFTNTAPTVSFLEFPEAKGHVHI